MHTHPPGIIEITHSTNSTNSSDSLTLVYRAREADSRFWQVTHARKRRQLSHENAPNAQAPAAADRPRCWPAGDLDLRRREVGHAALLGRRARPAVRAGAGLRSAAGRPRADPRRPDRRTGAETTKAPSSESPCFSIGLSGGKPAVVAMIAGQRHVVGFQDRQDALAYYERALGHRPSGEWRRELRRALRGGNEPSKLEHVRNCSQGEPLCED